VELTVQAFREDSRNVTICSGGSYTLPWGQVVRTAGVYRDTLRYGTGCDSLRRTIVLTVTPAAVAAVQQASICAGEVYRLPWGLTVGVAGTYRDTVRTASGCDSLVRTVRLEVRPLPEVRASWSNDVNCVLSVTRLQATGARTYRWRPGGTLSDSTAADPVARPQVTTRYVVEGTGANGCRSRDSVVVSVNFSDDPQKYLVASAFTPNGDGLNDCFGVRHWGDVTGFRLQVFNRYGSMVYETEDPRKCWDGRYRGIPQVPGVYVYVIRAEGPCGEVLRKGTVTLIR
jgi:gliding motility-associated-like protein